MNPHPSVHVRSCDGLAEIGFVPLKAQVRLTPFNETMPHFEIRQCLQSHDECRTALLDSSVYAVQCDPVLSPDSSISTVSPLPSSSHNSALEAAQSGQDLSAAHFWNQLRTCHGNSPY